MSKYVCALDEHVYAYLKRPIASVDIIEGPSRCYEDASNIAPKHRSLRKSDGY